MAPGPAVKPPCVRGHRGAVTAGPLGNQAPTRVGGEEPSQYEAVFPTSDLTGFSTAIGEEHIPIEPPSLRGSSINRLLLLEENPSEWCDGLSLRRSFLSGSYLSHYGVANRRRLLESVGTPRTIPGPIRGVPRRFCNRIPTTFIVCF